MIPKSGSRFSEEIMLNRKHDPESGNRFSEEIMLNKKQ
jgi:hypothetical protein